MAKQSVVPFGPQKLEGFVLNIEVRNVDFKLMENILLQTLK